MIIMIWEIILKFRRGSPTLVNKAPRASEFGDRLSLKCNSLPRFLLYMPYSDSFDRGNSADDETQSWAFRYEKYLYQAEEPRGA
jgi:hypothetical protein